MEIKFADTFSESLKTLIWHESRIYKFYSFLDMTSNVLS
jgi:hypothetical protein